MSDFYVRFGRRVPIPPTIQALDEISPDYRARLVREHRDRVRPPRAPTILSDLMRNPLYPVETSFKDAAQ